MTDRPQPLMLGHDGLAHDLGGLGYRAADIDRPRALVVDDDPVLRISIRRFVGKQGLSTLDCANGQEAVDLLSTTPVDIVLLDAEMPVMDGFSACAAMRALPHGERVPIIMITGHQDAASVDRAFAVGADEYITKPVHWPVLRHRLRQLIAAARAEQALRDDRAFLQSMVDAIPDPTLVCDAMGVLVWANRAARQSCLMCDARVGQRLRFAAQVHLADDADVDGDALLSSLLKSLIRASRPEQCLLVHRAVGRDALFAELHARPLLGALGASRGMILRLQDVTEREREGRKLRSEVSRFDQLAHEDPLTGLANRRLFERRLGEATREARERGTTVAVLFIDLDGFKAINDTDGHEVGDQVLKAIGERLTKQVRRSDTVARFGGDEFAVMIVGCPDLELLLRIGRKLLVAISAPLPADITRFGVGASVGAALYPAHAATDSELLRVADAAMYRVKHSGKGAIRLADEPPDQAVQAETGHRGTA